MSSSWEIESLVVTKVDGACKQLTNEQKLNNNMIIYPKNQQVVTLTIVANHDAMWHVDVFCHYLMIVMTKQL
jgi:hypothetical protein